MFRGFLSLVLVAVASFSLNAQAQPSTPASAAAPTPATTVPPTPNSATDDHTVLLRGPAGAVTLDQVKQALQTVVPVAQRADFFESPRNIEQLALSVYIHRALAAQAQKAGFDQRPEVAQAVAGGKRLSDLWLDYQAKQEEPTEEQLEKYARSVYEAQPPKRVGDMSTPTPDFESQRAALMDQARHKLVNQARIQAWNRAREGVEPDAGAILAQVREPVGR